MILPSGPVYAHVDEIPDLETRRMVIRQILKNAGFAGFFEGYNPFTIADDELNQVFTLGAGLGEVTFELSALTVLTVLYFGVGVWFFSKTQMKAS